MSDRKLEAALELISLLETCTACEAALHGPDVGLEEGAPHCLDCHPDDDQKIEWLRKIRTARRRLAKADTTPLNALTFGELEVGDHFVAFPHEGDTKRGNYVFKKTNGPGRKGDLIMNALKTSSGTRSNMPDGMFVVKVLP